MGGPSCGRVGCTCEVAVTGTTVGSYRVQQRLGQGGVGSVYRVEHTVLGTMHALKVLTMLSERAQKRLIAEGQIQARLNDPHLVAVRDVVDVGGHPGLVLDLVAGPTLGRLIASGPLPIEAIGRLGEGILRGMARAHEAGLVHRDLKPANVLLEVSDKDIVAKVADFGLAREAQGVGVTGTGASLGTPRYMAPEQVRDPRDVDARSDVWALGVVLYELCCGHPPFDRDGDLLELYGDIAGARYRPLVERRPEVPEPWLEALAAALQVEPEARPADASALLLLWLSGPCGPMPEGVLATARSLAPAMVDDSMAQPTWSGGGTFDSMGHERGGAPLGTALATPPEPVDPEPFVQAVAPLPDASRQEERREGKALTAWGMAGAGFGLVVALVAGGTFAAWLLFAPALGPLPPPVVAPAPVVEAPAQPDWPGARSSQRALQALLDGDALRAQEQASNVVAGAPLEDPQLVIIAARGARSDRISVWEEVERGRYFGLGPIQGVIADSLGDPDHVDADLMGLAHPAALFARIRMGPRHASRDAELLAALQDAAGDRRLVDMARAWVADEVGDVEGARQHLDRALEGADVPEIVRVRDALWHLNHGELDAAAASIDAVIGDAERPSFLA